MSYDFAVYGNVVKGLALGFEACVGGFEILFGPFCFGVFKPLVGGVVDNGTRVSYLCPDCGRLMVCLNCYEPVTDVGPGKALECPGCAAPEDVGCSRESSHVGEGRLRGHDPAEKDL